MTDFEARKLHIGGEVITYIWYFIIMIYGVLNVKPWMIKKLKWIMALLEKILIMQLLVLLKFWKKKLEINKIGYKKRIQVENLYLNIGFSHPVFVKPVVYNNIICKDATNIIIEGKDKCAVGSVVSSINNVRYPEPFNRKVYVILVRLLWKKKVKELLYHLIQQVVILAIILKIKYG